MHFKLFTRHAEGGHLRAIQQVDAGCITKASTAFRNHYANMGINADTLTSYVIVPFPKNDEGVPTPNWDDANGWDQCGSRTTFYPESRKKIGSSKVS